MASLTSEMEDSLGTSARIAAGQLDTFQGSVTLLTSAANALAIEVGSALAPMLRSMADLVTPLVQGFAAWAENNKLLVTVVVSLVAALGVLLLVGGLSLVMAGVLAASWGALGLSFGGVAAAASVMWVAITGPVGLAVAGVAAFIAIMVILYNRFESVRNMIDSIRRSIFGAGDAAKSIGPGATAAPIGAGVAPSTQEAVEDIASEVGGELQKVTSGLTTGQTRWRNVRLEEAQEDAADKIVGAIEGQTEELLAGDEAFDWWTDSLTPAPRRRHRS